MGFVHETLLIHPTCHVLSCPILLFTGLGLHVQSLLFRTLDLKQSYVLTG